MSSSTIRHSGVHENTQSTRSAARLAHGHAPQPTDHWAAASRYPPGFGPGEPYYEPAHLRHKPGDDWKIGGKPTDPEDPGPYGTPGWYQDRRTGRHRRGELPDPLPGTEPEAPKGYSRMHESEECSRAQESEGFSRLREDAYIAFLRDSEELHQAHYQTAEENRALVRLRWFLRVLLAVLYWRVLPFPEKPALRSSTSRAERSSGDVYRPKRAAGKPAERARKQPGARPGARPSDCTARRDGRPTPGRRPAPGPHAAQRRRLSTGTGSSTRSGTGSGTGTGAGISSGAASAPQAFFAAVRAARGQARMPSMPSMNGMTGAAGVVAGEAL